MPDGSICWTGPSCRKHGSFFTKNPLKKFVQNRTQQKTSKPLTQSEEWEAEEREEVTKLYSNIYDSLLKTGTLTFEDEPFPKEGSPRVGLNGQDKTKINQLNAEAIQVRMEITPEDKNVLASYQSSYEFVNAYLREGREGINKLTYLQRTSPHPTKPDTVSDETLDRYELMAKERISALDDTMERHARKNDNTQVLYRAFYLTEDSKLNHLTPEEYVSANFPVGKTFEEKAYMSTTNDSDYMLLYNAHLYEKQVVFEIKTNKGTVLHNPAESTGSIGAHERETLLPHGMKYKVVNVTNATYQNSYSDEAYKQASRRTSSAKKEQNFIVVQLEEIT